MLTDILELKQTGKGHFNGPCPWCGGVDRFVVWSDSDRYWCRQCNRKGDAIQFLRDYHGLSFHEAKRRVRSNHASEYTPRQSLERAVEAEFTAWKSAKHGDALERLGSAQSVVESLIACQRFSLSEQEAETLGRTLSEWYDRLDMIEEELVRYSPNPKANADAAREEWRQEQEDA